VDFILIEEVRINNLWFQLVDQDHVDVYVCLPGLSDWGNARYSKTEVEGYRTRFEVAK